MIDEEIWELYVRLIQLSLPNCWGHYELHNSLVKEKSQIELMRTNYERR